jgi:hypothetical protein
MGGEQQVEYGLEEKLNEYLSGFKSENPGGTGRNPADDDALDEYLLERAARELRAASERLRALERALKEG